MDKFQLKVWHDTVGISECTLVCRHFWHGAIAQHANILSMYHNLFTVHLCHYVSRTGIS